MTPLPPLSLYVHVPWCVRKCPYCDFNSHASPSALPEDAYIAALLADLEQDLPFVAERRIGSVFIGGGTPSLLSPAAYQRLFAGLRQRLDFAPDCEITLEANPGTAEHGRFAGYREAGINRLSLGVQSFDPDHLRQLGRIHDGEEALRAIGLLRADGFTNFNLDLMHGLPGQTVEQALADLRAALACQPSHLSWYQLTIEPNTAFFRQPPALPADDMLWAIQEAGQQLLAAQGFAQYEVSAYSPDSPSRHNLNYWQFGDYLGIGAGAHGKVSTDDGIHRYRKTRLPKDYLRAVPAREARSILERIDDDELPFEFMMNALRLRDGVPATLFSARTGLPAERIAATVASLRGEGLLRDEPDRLACTATGFNYLNDVLTRFLA